MLLEAKKTPKLMDCSASEIAEIITMAMVLLGIKGERLPTEFEMKYMSQMLKVDYAHFTIGELKLAFDLMIKNKLDENPETYQNFSALYLSRLMSSYSRWAYKHYVEEKIEPAKQLASPEVDEDSILDMSFNIYKRNKDWNHIFMGLKCFKILYKRNLINDIQGTLQRTEEAIKNKYLYAGHKEKKEMKRLLEDDDYMELACRRKAVSEYFDTKL